MKAHNLDQKRRRVGMLLLFIMTFIVVESAVVNSKKEQDDNEGHSRRKRSFLENLGGNQLIPPVIPKTLAQLSVHTDVELKKEKNVSPNQGLNGGFGGNVELSKSFSGSLGIGGSIRHGSQSSNLVGGGHLGVNNEFNAQHYGHSSGGYQQNRESSIEQHADIQGGFKKNIPDVPPSQYMGDGSFYTGHEHKQAFQSNAGYEKHSGYSQGYGGSGGYSGQSLNQAEGNSYSGQNNQFSSGQHEQSFGNHQTSANHMLSEEKRMSKFADVKNILGNKIVHPAADIGIQKLQAIKNVFQPQGGFGGGQSFSGQQTVSGGFNSDFTNLDSNGQLDWIKSNSHELLDSELGHNSNDQSLMNTLSKVDNLCKHRDLFSKGHHHEKLSALKRIIDQISELKHKHGSNYRQMEPERCNKLFNELGMTADTVLNGHTDQFSGGQSSYGQQAAGGGQSFSGQQAVAGGHLLNGQRGDGGFNSDFTNLDSNGQLDWIKSNSHELLDSELGHNSNDQSLMNTLSKVDNLCKHRDLFSKGHHHEKLSTLKRIIDQISELKHKHGSNYRQMEPERCHKLFNELGMTADTVLNGHTGQFNGGQSSYGQQAASGGQSSYGQQAFGGGQSSYGQQAASGGQSFYGQQAFGGGQSSYGQQAASGGQSSYGQQAFGGGQSSYGQQAFGGGQLSYGQQASDSGSSQSLSNFDINGQWNSLSNQFNGLVGGKLHHGHGHHLKDKLVSKILKKLHRLKSFKLKHGHHHKLLEKLRISLGKCMAMKQQYGDNFMESPQFYNQLETIDHELNEFSENSYSSYQVQSGNNQYQEQLSGRSSDDDQKHGVNPKVIDDIFGKPGNVERSDYDQHLNDRSNSKVEDEEKSEDNNDQQNISEEKQETSDISETLSKQKDETSVDEKSLSNYESGQNTDTKSTSSSYSTSSSNEQNSKGVQGSNEHAYVNDNQKNQHDNSNSGHKEYVNNQSSSSYGTSTSSDSNNLASGAGIQAIPLSSSNESSKNHQHENSSNQRSNNNSWMSTSQTEYNQGFGANHQRQITAARDHQEKDHKDVSKDQNQSSGRLNSFNYISSSTADKLKGHGMTLTKKNLRESVDQPSSSSYGSFSSSSQEHNPHSEVSGLKQSISSINNENHSGGETFSSSYGVSSSSSNLGEKQNSRSSENQLNQYVDDNGEKGEHPSIGSQSSSTNTWSNDHNGQYSQANSLKQSVPLENDEVKSNGDEFGSGHESQSSESSSSYSSLSSSSHGSEGQDSNFGTGNLNQSGNSNSFSSSSSSNGSFNANNNSQTLKKKKKCKVGQKPKLSKDSANSYGGHQNLQDLVRQHDWKQSLTYIQELIRDYKEKGKNNLRPDQQEFLKTLSPSVLQELLTLQGN